MISNGDFGPVHTCMHPTVAYYGDEISQWSVTLNGMVYGKIIFRD